MSSAPGTRTYPRCSLTAVAALVLLAACGDEDQTRTDITPSNDITSTSSDDSTGQLAFAVPGVADTVAKPLPPPDTVPLTLAPMRREPLRGSGSAGSAGAGTSVAVKLEGGIPGATYEGAIRRGSCARVGPDVASLYPVTTDSAGTGSSSSSVSVSMDSLQKAPHVVVYGPGGRPQSCGTI